jgi:predicted nucleic acid-binding Zn ribbon protein
MAEATERIPQHRHCVVCGKAYVGGDGRYCSENCKTNKAEELKKSKRKLLLIWAVAAALMIAVIVYELVK